MSGNFRISIIISLFLVSYSLSTAAEMKGESENPPIHSYRLYGDVRLRYQLDSKTDSEDGLRTSNISSIK